MRTQNATPRARPEPHWFRVTPSGQTPIAVRALNWVHAFGVAMALQGRLPPDRMASEVLSNGDALIRDVRTGEAWMVHDVGRSLEIPEGPSPEPAAADARAGWVM